MPVLVHACFLSIAVYLLNQLITLIDMEKLTVAEDFGIEKSVLFSYGRCQHNFIHINKVHKVIINEVIHFVRTGC